MAIGRSGKSVGTTMGVLAMGEFGTRKSSFALSSMKMKIPETIKGKIVERPARVLYIDIENGSVDSFLDDYEEEGYNLQNLFLIYTQSFTEVIDFVGRAKDNKDFYEFDEETGKEFNGRNTKIVDGKVVKLPKKIVLDGDGKPFRPDFIVIDGMALLYHSIEQVKLKFSELRAQVKASKDNDLTLQAKEVMIKGADLEFKDYKQLQFMGNKLIMDLIGSGKHFVVTSFAKDESKDDPEGKKDSQGKVVKVKTGLLIPEGFKELVKYCKTVLIMQEGEFGEIQGVIQRKDRTKRFAQGEVIPEPDLTMWQSVLDKNSKRDVVVVSNKLEETIKKEVDDEVSQNPSLQVDSESNSSLEVDFTNDDPTYYHKLIANMLNKYPKGTHRNERNAIGKKLKTVGLTAKYAEETDIELLRNGVRAIM